MPKITKGKRKRSKEVVPCFTRDKVGYILDVFKPPALILRQNLSSTNTTLAAHPRMEFQSVSEWSTFEQDLSHFRQDIKIDQQLVSPHQHLQATSVNCEKAVEMALINHIFSPVEAVLKALGSNFIFMHCVGLSRVVRFEPDIIAISEDEKSPIFCVEVKTPWALNLTGVNVVSTWNEESKLKEVCERRFQNAILQLYGYITYNNMKYGALTTYDHYVFVRRMPGSELQITQPIPAANCLKRLVEFVVLVSKDAHFSSPNESPIEELAEKGKKYEKAKSYQLVRLSPTEFCFRETVGSTKFGSVVRGSISGHKSVMFKVKDVAKEHGIAESLSAEASLYGKMFKIQGQCIPECLGLVDLNGFFFALVLEDCGPTLTAEEARNPAIKKLILKCLKAIHSCGVLHEDLELRNICYDRNNKLVKIIDFSHARKCTDKALFKGELELIEYLADDE